MQGYIRPHLLSQRIRPFYWVALIVHPDKNEVKEMLRKMADDILLHKHPHVLRHMISLVFHEVLDCTDTFVCLQVPPQVADRNLMFG